MTPRFSCALNGVSPEQIDPALRVTDLTELPPRRRVASVPTARHGLMMLRRVRESVTVRVSFILPEYDPVRRRALLQKLHAWGDPGGVLTTSDRPGQRLLVVCDTLPMLSALSWADEIHLEFTAYDPPFWEAQEETRVTTTGAADLLLPGDADEVPVACTVTNTGDAPLSTLTIRCGDTAMTFEGLSIAPGASLRLWTEGGVLHAEDGGGGDLIMCRTGDSHDLLLADCGRATAVSVTADQAVEAVFHARGRML